MERAAAYIRVSTEMQVGGSHVSLDVQLDAIRRCCQDRSYLLTGTYQDVESGRRADRPQYQTMIAAARRHEFDVLVVYAHSRLGRDRDELHDLFRDMRRLTVRVESATELIPDGRVGELVREIKMWTDEEESLRIGGRVRDALAHKIRTGYEYWGHPPYGWVPAEPGRLTVDPLAAALLHEMARLLLDENLSPNAIARRLTAHGQRRPSGSPWTGAAIRDLLIRPRNTGRLVWQGQAPASARIERNDLTPLWDDAFQAAINDRLNLRARLPRGRTQTSAYLLSGIVICAACGFPLVGHQTGNPRYPVRAYVCAGWRNRGVCAPRYHNAARLEAAVLAALAPAADAALALASMPEPAPARNLARELAALRRELARVEAAERRNLDALVAGTIASADQLARLNRDLDARHQALTAQIVALEAEAAVAGQRRERAAALPAQVRAFALAAGDLPIAQRKAELQRLVQRIEVGPDGLGRIVFREA